jgi:cell division protease FtsH
VLSRISNGIAGVWEGAGLLVSLINAATGSSGEEDEDCHMRPMMIIFIDEIDCLAKQCDSGIGLSLSLGGGGDKREQTLNQLLTEMDGFDVGGLSSSSSLSVMWVVNMIVIATTNIPKVLDPAIMRRFDCHVRVDLPNARGREAILRLHAHRIKLDHLLVDFASLPMHGFSGADLKSVIIKAALLVVRCRSLHLIQAHLLEVTQKIRMISLGNASTPGRHYVMN